MSVSYKSVLEGADQLQSVLADVPDRIQNRVFRGSGRKVAKAVMDRAKALTPRRKANGRLMGPQEHLADRYSTIQRVYRKSNTTVNIVGPRSGGHGRIAHIVEFGTAYRYTHHKTIYGPGRTVFKTRKRRVQTASGGWRTVTEKVKVRTKKSLGSRWRKTGLPDYRGRMPAFSPLQRAVDSTPINDIFDTELRAGLQRILDRQAS